MGNIRMIEALEGRRLLSVSGAQFGPILTPGAQWTTEGFDSGKLFSTDSQKVVGKTTFNKVSCTEIDHTLSSGGRTSFVKDYAGIDKSGNVVEYGSINTFKEGPLTYVTTYIPTSEQIDFPAAMNPQTVYKFNQTGTAAEVTTPGGNKQVTFQSDEATIELTSATLQSVTVPAGTFKAYLLDATTTIKVGTISVTIKTQYWDAPKVGFVKITSGTTTTEMTTFKA